MQDIVISVIANMISAINEIVHPISASCSAALPLFHLFLITTAAPPFHSAAMPLGSIRDSVFVDQRPRRYFNHLQRQCRYSIHSIHSQRPRRYFSGDAAIPYIRSVWLRVFVIRAPRKADRNGRYPRAAGCGANDVDANARDGAFRDAFGKPMPCG